MNPILIIIGGLGVAAIICADHALRAVASAPRALRRAARRRSERRARRRRSGGAR